MFTSSLTSKNRCVNPVWLISVRKHDSEHDLSELLMSQHNTGHKMTAA